MVKLLRVSLFLGALLALTAAASRAEDDKGEMVENPMYKFWAGFKPGATTTVHEVTKFLGEDKDSVPGGIDRFVDILGSVGMSEEELEMVGRRNALDLIGVEDATAIGEER